MSKANLQAIQTIKVRQWLPSWNQVSYDESKLQRKPEPHFYLFSMAAKDLKRLTGVYRRSAKRGVARAKDPNVQRGHEEQRSSVIREFVKNGYPWCEMSDTKRNLTTVASLRKPGWLPTAILVNILEPGDERNQVVISDSDLIHVKESNGRAELLLPKNYNRRTWEPSQLFPLEVIDGQHRLWAFEGFDPGDGFELPVVAFRGLDRSWQAYLFWSVNITPKRINRSLAYDLYPLLRREDWLDKFAGHPIYRETRAQELVEALWGHPQSPWFQRINMLGETISQRGSSVPMVSQAAWVRSLMASFIKEWVDQGSKPGGLFGAPRAHDDPLLPWNRAMQAAFLINFGRLLREATKDVQADWAKHVRLLCDPGLFEDDDDPAFYGQYSLLTTDQGIRGLLFVANDLCYVQAQHLQLREWRWEAIEGAQNALTATDEQAVTDALDSMSTLPVTRFLRQIVKRLASYDWRTSSTPGLSDTEKRNQSVFRGSSGYRELRQQLLQHLEGASDLVADTARQVREAFEK